MKGLVLVALVVAFALAMTPVLAQAQTLVQVGSIAPITGGASGYGADISAAIRLAIQDYNDGASGFTLVLDERDSATDPQVAIREFEDLHDSGVRIFAGPALDGLINAVVQQDNARDSLFLSCCSVTPTLSIQDNVFRIIPDHSTHGEAIAGAIEEHGIDAVVPVGRDNPWITELFDATRTAFSGEPERFGSPILYVDLEYDDAARTLAAVLAESDCLKDPACNAAVLYIGFEESRDFLERSLEEMEIEMGTAMHDLTWFSADVNTVTPKVAQSRAVLDNLDGFVSVQPIIYENPVKNRVGETLSKSLGREPSVYAYTAYDSFMLMGRAIEIAGTADADAVRDAIPGAIVGYDGALGPTSMNDYGDLEEMNYGVWRLDSESAEWLNTEYYNPATSEILQACEISLANDMMDFGFIPYGSNVSGEVHQSVVNSGPRALTEIKITAVEWYDKSNSVVTHGPVTELRTGDSLEWTAVDVGYSVSKSLAPYERVDIAFRINVEGAQIPPETSLYQDVTYGATCG